MDRYLVINENNLIVNIVRWNGKSKWMPPYGCYVVKSEFGNIGQIYDKETGLCFDLGVKNDNTVA
jgi:hypothetical protein